MSEADDRLVETVAGRLFGLYGDEVRNAIRHNWHLDARILLDGPSDSAHEHHWIEITVMGDKYRQEWCPRCDRLRPVSVGA